MGNKVINLALGLFIASSMVLSACGGSKETGGTTTVTPGPTREPVPALTATPPLTPETPLPCNLSGLDAPKLGEEPTMDYIKQAVIRFGECAKVNQEFYLDSSRGIQWLSSEAYEANPEFFNVLDEAFNIENFSLYQDSVVKKYTFSPQTILVNNIDNSDGWGGKNIIKPLITEPSTSVFVFDDGSIWNISSIPVNHKDPVKIIRDLAIETYQARTSGVNTKYSHGILPPSILLTKEIEANSFGVAAMFAATVNAKGQGFTYEMYKNALSESKFSTLCSPVLNNQCIQLNLVSRDTYDRLIDLRQVSPFKTNKTK